MCDMEDLFTPRGRKKSSLMIMLSVGAVISILNFFPIGCGKTGDGNGGADPRVMEILDRAGLKYEINDGGDFRLGFRKDVDRRQVVFISSTPESFQNIELREVWSLGHMPWTGDIPPPVAVDLLERNAQVSFGAWQMLRDLGKDVIFFAVRIPADTGAEALLGAIQLVIQETDDFENALRDGNSGKFETGGLRAPTERREGCQDPKERAPAI